jgi:malate synthase
MRMTSAATGVEIQGPATARSGEILHAGALELVAGLHRLVRETRRDVLDARRRRQRALDAGETPDFLAATRGVREAEWRVTEAPADLRDRRVEITGPAERKMIINALNSGARVFMADFEDATSPTWANVVDGQGDLVDAVEGTISLAGPDGREYRLNERTATLVVRPRGWHLVDRHLLVDGEPVAASVFDAGLFLAHNARRLLDRGSGPYLYIPKLEGHLEARLWNQVLGAAEEMLGLPAGTVRTTVLIETVLAAFEMDEILFELRGRSCALNAGRWDYMFSIIKKLGRREEFVLPDRNSVTMGVPFMRAYTELLVRTCHRRGAHAIGGMAAFIPSRRDPEVNRVAIERVREDKEREANAGFDGTWVAHPDLVPVATEVFDAVLGSRPNQVERTREDVAVDAAQLLDVRVPGARITEQGLRNDVSVGLQYLESWLRGYGAAGIYNLMEDAATAEIARSQLWQWIHHGVALAEGPRVTADLVREVLADELARLADGGGEGRRLTEAARILEEVALGEDFVEFLTVVAYPYLQ